MSGEDLRAIRKEETPLPLSQHYLKNLDEQEKQQSHGATNRNILSSHNHSVIKVPQADSIADISPEDLIKEERLHEHRATFPDTPIRPTEKRKVHSNLHLN